MFTLLILTLVTVCLGAATFTPARPPSLPLAVRSPYLNTWLSVGSDGAAEGNLPGNWPTFWAGAIVGWAGQIRVDATVYTWMGDPLGGAALASQTAVEYTATKTTFVMNVADTVALNITFDSPIFPKDFERQSLVFSYMNVAVQSLDGASHSVQLYTDVSGEWASGDRTSILQWQYGTTGNSGNANNKSVESLFELARKAGVKRQVTNSTTTATATATTSASNSTVTTPPTSTFPAGGIAYHKFFRQTQLAFSEIADQTEYGDWYYATDNVAKLTFQSGADVDVRGQFQAEGFLADTQDSNFRAINDRFPVFGFAINLGDVSTSPSNTLFSIGLTQELAIQFDGAQGNVSLPSLWTSYFSDEVAALSFFHDDFSTAIAVMGSFDAQVMSDATAVAGNDYYIITALAARQAFGALQLVGTQDKTYLFMKEISSDGNTQTVDVIFPLHPILTYTNPVLLKLMLDPLFENQEAGRYPNQFSMHDLGSHYPNATGHEDGNDEHQPLEECGNMLIMTLAYVQLTGDTGYLSQHYTILTQWTSFLIAEALIPADQISTDDFAGSLANQTNLALKGIIGIEAMSQIANLTGHAADANNFTTIAHDYISQWQTLGIAPTTTTTPAHAELNYGNTTSHVLLYNLFADAELHLGLVPQSVYDMQSAFYPTVAETFGVPLDTRHTYTKLDWETWCAAIATDQSTRDLFLTDIVNWINQTPTDLPLTDLYDTISGDFATGVTFRDRPVVGGTYALLTLQGKTGTVRAN